MRDQGLVLLTKRTSAVLSAALLTVACQGVPTLQATSTPSPSPIPIGYEGNQVTANKQWTPVVQSFDGVDMVLVPAGCFMMGSTDEQITAAVTSMHADLDWVKSLAEDEFPVSKVCFDNPYWIDKVEVTNAQFAQFGGKAAEDSEWNGDLRPREKISQKESQDFCEKRGARLPTEPEWEYSARGPDDLLFPWGNEFEAANTIYSANSGRRPWDVGGRLAGASWVGALDLAGNIAEWTSSAVEPYPYDASHEKGVEDGLFTGAGGIIRGGSWFTDNYDMRAADRDSLIVPELADAVGFRCLRSTSDPQADIAAAAAAPTPSITSTPNPPVNGAVIFDPATLPSSYIGPQHEGVLMQLGLGALTDTSVSPDGKYIALATSSAVQLYQTDALELVWSIPVNEAGDLAWSQDGTRLAANSYSNVTVWDVPSGHELFSTPGKQSTYPKFALTPDSRYLVSTPGGGDMVVWDTTTGNKLRSLGFSETPPDPEHPKVIGTSFEVSPDGRMIALAYVYSAPWGCCYLGHTAVVWNIVNGTQLLKVEEPILDQDGAMAGIYDLAWSPDSQNLAIYNIGLDVSSNVEFWDISTGSKRGTVETSGFRENLSWSPNGQKVAAYGDQNSAIIDATTFQTVFKFGFDSYKDQFLGWSDDASLFAIHSLNDDSVSLRDSNTGYGRPWTPAVTGADSFTPDFERFFFRGRRSTEPFENRPYESLIVWDAKANAVDKILATGLGQFATDTSWSPDGSQVAFRVETGHRQVLIWDIQANTAVVSIDSGDGVFMTSWSPDGKTFAIVLDNIIDFYDASTWTSLGTISMGTNMGHAIWSFSWSADSKRIAIMTYPNKLQVREIPSGQIVYEKTISANNAVAAWSPDGKQIATAGDQGNVEMWDAATGERLRVFSINVNQTSTPIFSFSPDFSMLAGIGWSGPMTGCEGVSIWSLSSGEVIQSFPHAWGPCDPRSPWNAWLPDSSGLVLQTDDGTGIFSPKTGQLLTKLPAMPDVFSPDGRRFAAPRFGVIMLREVPR